MYKLGQSSKLRKLADMLNINKSEIASADLVCGYSCPMADKCKSFADKQTGKITDGKNTIFRCYGATLEGAFPSVRALHWQNFQAMIDAKTTLKMKNEIIKAISPKIKVLRIHSFGDFFNENYFRAWLAVAEKFPQISFFGYTKVLPYVSMAKPDNFKLVYSYGGLMDDCLTNEATAYVVNNISEAETMNLPVACQIPPADDYNFILNKKSFALVLHGIQPVRN